MFDDTKEKENVNLKIDIMGIVIETTTPKSGGPNPYFYI